METNQKITRKRKQSNNNPLTGIFTRSKSRRYLHHCNRSGKFRPDPLRKNRNPFSPSTQKSSYVYNKVMDEYDDDDDDEIYHISIKDLRARRVFSRPIGKNKTISNVDCDLVGRDLGKSEGFGSEISLSKCGSGVEGLNVGNPNLGEKCELGVSIKYEGLNVGNPSLSVSGNPNLLKSKNCDSRVDFKDVCSNVGNPNLLMSEKCDSRVDFKDICSNVENPNLLKSEKLDSRVDFVDERSNSGNPNFAVSEKCDTGFDLKAEGLNGENPNLPMELNGGSVVSCGGGERMRGEKAEKFDVGLASSGAVLDEMSPALSNKDIKVRKGEECEGLIEGNVQTTPPEAVILVREAEDRNVLQKRKAASSSPPKQISPSRDLCAEGKKSFSKSKRNSVLKACSRPKVFKAPNSFSYRRLLPYLMDLEKDTTSGLKVSPCRKLENDVEEKPLASSSQESLVDVPKSGEKEVPTMLGCTQDVNTDNKEEKIISLDLKETDSSAQQAVVETLIDNALDNRQSNLAHENTVIIDNPEGVSIGKKVSSDNFGKLGDVSQAVESDIAALSDMSKQSPEASPKDATPASPSHISPDAEGECTAAQAEVKTEETSPSSVYHSPSKLEVVVSSAALGGQAKGILKKNPRGCRGICNCLHCSSFRLNAKKAFEFSKNQLLDAEELALDLMKELSSLRGMLEKSVNGDNSHAIVPANQVYEACSKASRVEDLARNRLSQMSEDLHVHCRTKLLERPRVNFSSQVKEKIIGELSKKIDQNVSSGNLGL